jgi:hypothetical protein
MLPGSGLAAPPHLHGGEAIRPPQIEALQFSIVPLFCGLILVASISLCQHGYEAVRAVAVSKPNTEPKTVF